jgi:hypothetical protein
MLNTLLGNVPRHRGLRRDLKTLDIWIGHPISGRFDPQNSPDSTAPTICQAIIGAFERVRIGIFRPERVLVNDVELPQRAPRTMIEPAVARGAFDDGSAPPARTMSSVRRSAPAIVLTD